MAESSVFRMAAAFMKSLSLEPSVDLSDLSPSDVRNFQELVRKCWKDLHTGLGQDASGLSHSGIRVTNVTKLDNQKVLDRYLAHKEVCLSKKDIPGMYTRAGPVKKYLAEINTKDFDPTFMPGERRLDGRINEVYLFHGTGSHNVESIRQNGFDLGRASSSSLYGKWIYLTDSAQKADQYTGMHYHINTIYCSVSATFHVNLPLFISFELRAVIDFE